jgi:LysM repeat protein
MKFTYIVQDGDSISKISKKFNIKTSVIQELNPKIKTILAIGQKLTLIKDKPEFPYITKKLKELQGK